MISKNHLKNHNALESDRQFLNKKLSSYEINFQ